MKTERELAQFVSDTEFEDLPREAINAIKNVVLTILGTTMAGATAEGCEAVVNQVKEWGGKREATILIHGGEVPAYNAVFANSFMARALDVDDAMFPGIHVGASSVPTALATVELVGGCSGKEFLTALVLGHEVTSRMNSISDYDGFDPTGVCTIFASTVAAGKILRLNSAQMLGALALAFNRSGGSFQSNVDGSLAIRAIQGFASQGGIISVQLAQKGITGPRNFIEGVHGYFHLFAKDKRNSSALTKGMGQKFGFSDKILFKKYPSCAATAGSTAAILELVREKNLTPEDITRIDIKVTPFPGVYQLVGHQFKIGKNPRVNAQFSIQYCVANALLRRSSKLQHFEESQVREPRIMELVKKVHVAPDPELDQGRPEFHLRTELKVTTEVGEVYHKVVDIPRGAPGNPLTDEEHQERFRDYVSYAGRPLPSENIDKIASMVGQLEEVEDVRSLIPLLLA